MKRGWGVLSPGAPHPAGVNRPPPRPAQRILGSSHPTLGRSLRTSSALRSRALTHCSSPVSRCPCLCAWPLLLLPSGPPPSAPPAAAGAGRHLGGGTYHPAVRWPHRHVSWLLNVIRP